MANLLSGRPRSRCGTSSRSRGPPVPLARHPAHSRGHLENPEIRPAERSMRRSRSLPALPLRLLLHVAIAVLDQPLVCDLGIRRNTRLQFSCCELLRAARLISSITGQHSSCPPSAVFSSRLHF